jgi:hypothetical protein
MSVQAKLCRLNYMKEVPTELFDNTDKSIPSTVIRMKIHPTPGSSFFPGKKS